MTVAAEKLLDVFETLTPDEQLFVREQVNQLTEGSQRLVIDRLRGASAGKQLLSKLIGDRQVERDRG